MLGDFPSHEAPFLAPGQEAGGETRRLAMVLAYDGAPFAGWQLQANKPTVQGAVEKALAKLCNHPVRLAASGRTDSGVHALGQVAAFDTTSRLDLDRMGRGLKALLPEQIHLRELGETPPGFHPRFDALGKTYDYYLWPGAAAPLFLLPYLWPLRKGLDLERMTATLAALPGERDFAPMASRCNEAKGSTLRQVSQAELKALPGGVWLVRLSASGFLRHVVRNLVGSLVQVGRGSLKSDDFLAIFEPGSTRPPGPKAPGCGLFLRKVYYKHPPDKHRDQGG
jgi:tRNA pseudouridine38-40 synthase